MTPAQFCVAIVLNALMLPVPFEYPVMFPVNSPLWSLFCEMAINIAYALFLVRLRTLWLGLVALAGAMALIFIAVSNPTIALEGGGALQTIGVGLARVTFGFCTGMLIARYVRGTKRKATPLSLALAIPLMAFIIVPVEGHAVAVRDLFFVFAVVPLIIWIGAKTEVPKSAARLFAFLGDLSYPLYAVHYPIILAVCFAGVRSHLPSYLVAVIALGAAFAAAIVAERFYDRPVRKWLSLRLGLRESAPPQVIDSDDAVADASRLRATIASEV
jgi:peptidoglycan/LPS O-acetylase OafA/YrhL